MKQEYFILAPEPAALPPVTLLECRDAWSFDPDPLASLAQERGIEAAEEIACRALEDLAERLDQLDRSRRRGATGDIIVPAQRMSKLAEQIGLTEIARAAGHLAKAAGQNDGVAIEATFCRLQRAFDLATAHIWRFSELF